MKKILLILFIILLNQAILAENYENLLQHPKNKEIYNFTKKNKLIAGTLSFFFSGGGQFYTRNYLKGFALFCTEGYLAIKSTKVNRYRNDTNYSSIILLGVKVFSIYDAVNSVEKFNKVLYQKLENNITNSDTTNSNIINSSVKNETKENKIKSIYDEFN